MPPIDYAALAAQARKSKPIDYAALAAQAKAESQTPLPAPDAPSMDWTDRVVQWLPEAGAVTGGVLGTAAGGPPGGVMLAALLGGGGEAYKQLINRARGHVAVPATSDEAGQDIGRQMVRQGGAQAVGSYVVEPALRAVGTRFMQSAVKPGLKVLLKGLRADDTMQPVVRTLLDEGVNVTPGGVAKLQMLVKATDKEIADALAPASGTISPLSVASRLSDTARTYANQVNPQADLEAISQVGENFLAAHGSQPLSVQSAQSLKTGTYARIGEKYGHAAAAAIEAEKALARGLKEEIASEVPSVSALNARDGKLLEALDTVGRRVALAGNRDPIGFAWVTQNPMTFLAALIDRSPLVKSLLARGAWTQAARAGKVAPQAIRVAMHALMNEAQPTPSNDQSPQ